MCKEVKEEKQQIIVWSSRRIESISHCSLQSFSHLPVYFFCHQRYLQYKPFMLRTNLFLTKKLPFPLTGPKTKKL